jgi:hypothetical protein
MSVADMRCESDGVKEALTNVSTEAVSKETDDNIDTMIDSSKATAVEFERMNEINDAEDKSTNTGVVSAADCNGKQVDAGGNDIVSSDEIQDNKIQETADNEEKTNLPPCFRNLPEPILGKFFRNVSCGSSPESFLPTIKVTKQVGVYARIPADLQSSATSSIYTSIVTTLVPILDASLAQPPSCIILSTPFTK